MVTIHDANLTENQKRVLREICTGATNQQIADKLCIEKSTVGDYCSNIYFKIDVKGRSGAVVWALKTGFVEMDELEAA